MWRYRLGVRTEDSQSSNPGSIPGSATKQSSLQRSLRRYSRKQAKLPGCCNSSGSNQGRRKTSFQKNTLLVELFSPVVEQGSVSATLNRRKFGDQKPEHLRNGLTCQEWTILSWTEGSNPSCSVTQSGPQRITAVLPVEIRGTGPYSRQLPKKSDWRELIGLRGHPCSCGFFSEWQVSSPILKTRPGESLS